MEMPITAILDFARPETQLLLFSLFGDQCNLPSVEFMRWNDASLQLRKSKRCGYKANLVRQRLPQAHEQLFIPLLMHSLIDVALGKFSGLTVITLRLFCQPFPVFPAFAQTCSRVPRPLTATLELRAVPIARYQIRNRSKPPTLRPCCAIYSHHVRLGFAVLLASQYTTFSEEKQPHLFDYR